MKLNIRNLIYFATLSYCLFDIHAYAATQSNSQIVKDDYIRSQLTQSEYEHLTSEQQKAIAEIWGITPSDYRRYLFLMQNTPNGLYYQDKNLEPSWILGFNAKNESEIKKFVAIAIKNERIRISRELAFQRAFDEVQHALYPNEKPIRMEAAFETPSAPLSANDNIILQSGDNLLLFTDISNSSAQSIIQKVLYLLALHPGAKLNIYLVGDKLTDEVIRVWAARNKIPVNLVKNNTITLNHDDGRFQKLTQGKSQFPLLSLSRNNEVTVLDINHLS